MADTKPTATPVRAEPAPGDTSASTADPNDVTTTGDWPAQNPEGIARVKQGPSAFRRGDTASEDREEPPSPSVGVSFSNPTPPTVPSVGPKPPEQLEPADVSGPVPILEEPEPEEAGFLDPFGGNPEWSGWTKKIDVDPAPPPPTEADVSAPHRMPPPEGADVVTEPSMQSVDLAAKKRAGRAEPLVTLGEGDEQPSGKSEVTGPRMHSRAQAQKEDAEAVVEGPPPKPEPRNYSQFVAVIVILIILNVPAILVLYRYVTRATGPDEPAVEVAKPRTITPEDLALITDEMWARPGQADTVLVEWELSADEYSRLMAGVYTDPELNQRYEAARRTGPRGERKADLRPRATPEEPSPAPDEPSSAPEVDPKEPAVGADEDPP